MCVYVYMLVCVYTYACIYVGIHVCVCTHLCIRACMYVCMCVCANPSGHSSKAWVCGSSPAGSVVSNPAGGMDVCVL